MPRSVWCAGFVALAVFADVAVAAPQKVSELSTDLFNGSSAPAGFQALNGAMMFFSRSGPLPGLGLFRSDGTAAGTVLVRDLDPKVRVDGTAPRIVLLNGRGYWSQGGSLWVTDGTPAGTQVVAMFASTLGDDPTEPVVFHNALYFGGDGSLYRSDGTMPGTQVLAPTIRPVGRWQEMGGRLYFACEVGTSGIELCATDGTAIGTSMVRDLFPGIQSSDPIFLGVVGSKLLFSAVTDPQFFMRGLWSSDGTAAGTQELVAPPGDRFQDAIDRFEPPAAVLGALAYIPCFTVQLGFELCKTDGTPAGTSVLDVVPDQGSLHPFRVVALGARLIFVAFDAAAGEELWTSNGTVAGTSRLVDLVPGPSDGARGGLIPVGSTVYFAGRSA